MIRRAGDLSDKDYGGRGVKVDEAWLPENGGFEFFLMNVGPRPLAPRWTGLTLSVAICPETSRGPHQSSRAATSATAEL